MKAKDLSFTLPVVITKLGKRFVAYTPALDISTSGKSERDVREKFETLANLFFEEIIEAGTVAAVLTELGWKKEQKKWTPPSMVSSKSMGIRTPEFA